MKKRMLISVLLLVLILLMAGCICEHEWLAATCAAPKTCQLCGETEGETLPHTWQDATCSIAKTCTVCQATEGETLPHTWQNATCTVAKTCTVCQATEGETLPHTWQDATCTVAKTCSVCNNTEGQPMGHAWLNATCTTVKTCSVCQATEGEPLGHSYSKEEILIAATCTQAGEKKYICARCDHSTNKSIEAIGHKWEGATCINAGVCTKCGATGSKANHNYTTTTLKEFNETFAGRRVMKCNDCNKEITEYFTDSYTFNLSAIAEEIAAYAAQKGFRPIIEAFSDYEKKSSFSVLISTIAGYGPNKLVSSGKAHIDYIYNRLTEYGNLGKRNLHIHVYYTQSGALGGGYFGVYTKTSLYE